MCSVITGSQKARLLLGSQPGQTVLTQMVSQAGHLTHTNWGVLLFGDNSQSLFHRIIIYKLQALDEKLGY